MKEEYSKLGFDSFDRAGEVYCSSSISSANSNSTIAKSFATKEGRIELDTDGIVYHGQNLTSAFGNLKNSVTCLQGRLTDVLCKMSVFDNRLKKIEENNHEKENKKDIQHINRSVFKTLRYGRG